MSGQVFDYVRVSTSSQNEARQVAALSDVDKIYMDKVSGKNTVTRDQLNALRAFVRVGDVVKVKAVDRLARNSLDLLQSLEEFKNKGVTVKFIDSLEFNTDAISGKLVITVLGTVAEFERESIRQHQAEGIAQARKRGVYRTSRISQDDWKVAKRDLEAGVPKSKIAQRLNISRTTLYKVLDEGLPAFD
ncbi:resolvase [Corynebacterium resistens DSM 45100]|uniref:Resolvase n=1 Tax=Corynebacterium resistens (strain DSM 45100 / JCM 12819 / GTC 2026 / SICGH 158) TaxID=662755 RepID=F8E298_CORRG|nr:recombinase family protein [Corynebacterium resistens]AEI10216.1 resolvase [Corynebacterium resistens DSM 45100]